MTEQPLDAQAKTVSPGKIALSGLIWFVVFWFLFSSLGNILLPVCSIWYLLLVTPVDDPRRKVRMLIVGFYSLAFSLLYIILAQSLIYRYMPELDPLTKYANVCAILAYVKLVLGIAIFIKAPFIFGQKRIRAYQNKIANQQTMQEAELEKEAGSLRGTWSSELREQIAEALQSGDPAQIEWARDELQFHSDQGVQEAAGMLKDQPLAK